MRLLARICICVVALSFLTLGQVTTVPDSWTGTWKLNVDESTFGTVLVPYAPANLKILSQTLRIERAANGIRITGDTVLNAGGESQTSHDDSTLRLDGTPTNLGPVSLSFQRIDNFAFEVTSSIDVPGTNVGEVSRYVFASEGSRLTATKIQTQRAPVPAGMDKSEGEVIRASKFILVYDRVPEQQ